MKDLEKLFIETLYHVYTHNNKASDYVIKVGVHHPDLDILLNGQKSWMLITAWNPLPIIFTKNENKARNKILQQELIDSELKFFPAKGIASDLSWEEPGFFVMGADLDTYKNYARKHGQAAILYGEPTGKAQLIWLKSPL